MDVRTWTQKQRARRSHVRHALATYIDADLLQLIFALVSYLYIPRLALGKRTNREGLLVRGGNGRLLF